MQPKEHTKKATTGIKLGNTQNNLRDLAELAQNKRETSPIPSVITEELCPFHDEN